MLREARSSSLGHLDIYLTQSIVHEHRFAGPGCIREAACITLSVAKHWSGGDIWLHRMIVH